MTPQPISPQVAISTAHAKLTAVESALNAALIGRDDVIRATLVALVAREHIVLLGPPGSSKSYLVELLSRSVAGAHGNGLRLFEWLLGKFTTPDEIFGPVSLKAYKDERYERITTNKLPCAEIAFLDEIFKANEAILMSLLTILNERKYDNGPQRIDVPLQSLIGASNELPQADESGALWDRFLLRKRVEYVDDGGFARLLLLDATPTLNTIDAAELATLQQAAAALPIPDSVIAALVKLRRDLTAKGITASDRRWRKSLRLLQAHAVIEGRDAVDEEDLSVLRDVLWQTPDQAKTIAAETAQIANPKVARILELLDAATVAHRDGMGANGDDATATTTIVKSLTTIKKAADEMRKLRAEMQREGRNLATVDKHGKTVKRYHGELAEKMGIG